MEILDDNINNDENSFANLDFRKRLSILANATRIVTFIIAIFFIINIIYLFEHSIMNINMLNIGYFVFIKLITNLILLGLCISYSFKASNNILDFTVTPNDLNELDKGLKYFTRLWICIAVLIAFGIISNYFQ